MGRGGFRARGDGGAVGVFRDAGEPCDFDGGRLEGSLNVAGVSGRDQARVGDEERPLKPKIPGEMAHPFGAATTEDHPRARLEIERNHREVNSITRWDVIFSDRPRHRSRSLAMQTADLAPRTRLTPIQWLICTIAAVGFAFDIYEILMLPLIVRPALLELTGAAPGSPEFQMWVGRLFYIPAFSGGIFGLIGGYMTDRFGRRRVLTYSILIYAVSAFLSGFATSIGMLLALRCLVFIGVCVEFVAAVAWLAELFPEPKRREKVLGYTQAFSSFGGLLVAFANGWCVAHAASLPALTALGSGVIANPHAP